MPSSRLLPFVLLLLMVPSALSYTTAFCEKPYCSCSSGSHPQWSVVNCTVPDDVKLDIRAGDLPCSTNELIVTGGAALYLYDQALSKMRSPQLVRVRGAKIVRINTLAGFNIDTVNFVLSIRESDDVTIAKHAFTGVKGPISVDIDNVNTCTFEDSAFAWLLVLNVSKVKNLVVLRGAFTLDPTAPNVGTHGPGMMINLMDSSVDSFPASSFASSAAQISLRNLQIGTVQTDAFSANTYNVVMITNCSIAHIESEAFSKKSLIHELKISNYTRIKRLSTNALLPGVSTFKIMNTTFDNVETGAIVGTYATILILGSSFHNIAHRSFEFTEWNNLKIENSKFDEVPPNAIIATPTTSSYTFSFKENEIETFHPKSLEFVGLIYAKLGGSNKSVYGANYYGQQCSCEMIIKILEGLGGGIPADIIKEQSYCTVNEVIARCFNTFEQNMLLQKFIEGVCTDNDTIMCEPSQLLNGTATEIKNTRFPHVKEVTGLSPRNAKVIGIVIVTCVGCFLLALLISLIRYLRRRGHCMHIKSCNHCGRMCTCGGGGLANAGSISQISVQDYTERHRLNDVRVDIIQETAFPQMYTEEDVPTDDKTTQTLPEELTKELLENLKEKLDDPANYVEAREMIEHLYELIKVDETITGTRPGPRPIDENIYELPFHDTTPRVGKNNKKMVSVGTRVPSLERLQPLSPYNRNTALTHEYFEPRDFAIHLYAEIANCGKDKRTKLGVMPDVVGDQVLPRGPYLRAVREKMGPTSLYEKPITFPNNNSATMKSEKSITSNASGKNMLNRPLPQKPITALDAGEGTSRSCD